MLFADEPLFAWLDSGGTILESNESNNVARAGGVCAQRFPVGEFAPRVEGSWQGSATSPTSVGVMTTPLVVDLDGDTRPEIVFSTHTGASLTAGPLRAIRGRDRSEVFTTATTMRTTAQIAMGDIDADGRPEIMAVSPVGTSLLAFEHDGTLKWTSAAIENVGDGGPAIANVDGVGLPEIVIGRQVFEHRRHLRWTGTAGVGGTAGPRLSIVADLDRRRLARDRGRQQRLPRGRQASRGQAAGTADGLDRRRRRGR